MVRGWLGVGVVFLALFGLWGCGPGPPVEVKPQGSLERAKAILNDYVQGAPLGSEAMTFQEIVEEVRQSDPKKAEILEKGFAELKRSPASRGAKARELLQQL